MTKTPVKPALAALAVLGLVACSNERPDVNVFNVTQSYLQRAPEPVVDDPVQVARGVEEAIRVLDGPLALATFEKTRNNVILRQIETNGSYRTWTSWGSSERRSVTTKNGVITATRGLREDLMSADIDASLALISARQSGAATRVQRYLDGENQIVEVSVSCTITRGTTTRVQTGSIDRPAVEMTELCEDGTRRFRNLYRVDTGGRVLQSVQWLNDFYGKAVIQALR